MTEANHFFSGGTNQYDSICAFLGPISYLLKEKIFIADSLTATLLGVAFGPVAINLLDPSQWPGNMDRATYEFSDLVINIQIMAAAIALPRRFWRESSRSLALLLGPVTLYMWLASSLIYYFVLGLSPVDALIVAACTAPTDPVLANSIVHGRFADMYIPKFIQQLLSAESTANDSIAAPLFYLATYMHEYTNASEALVKWTYMAILYEMGGAVVVGIIIGYVTRITLRLSVRRRWIDKHSFLLFELALATFTQGISAMLNINVFLAVFITGFTFSWDGWFHEQVGDEHVQGVIDMIVNLVYFLFFGVSIPWSSFNSLDFPLWKLFVCAILILIFRRLPAILAISRIMSPKLSFSEAVTVGWFGPVGVGAMWYEVLASTKLPENASFKIIIYFIVLCNVVVHGLVVPIIHFSIKIFRPGYSQKAKEKAKLAAGNMIIGSLRGEVDHTPSSNVSVLNGLHINNHNTTGNNRAPSFTGSHCSTSTKHHMEDVKEIVHVTQLHQLVPATPLPSMAQQPNQTKLSRSNSSHH